MVAQHTTKGLYAKDGVCAASHSPWGTDHGYPVARPSAGRGPNDGPSGSCTGIPAPPPGVSGLMASHSEWLMAAAPPIRPQAITAHAPGFSRPERGVEGDTGEIAGPDIEWGRAKARATRRSTGLILSRQPLAWDGTYQALPGRRQTHSPQCVEAPPTLPQSPQTRQGDPRRERSRSPACVIVA